MPTTIEQSDPIRAISTGVAGLDDVLEGGLPANHLYLIEGEPGSGKTTLGLQFLLAGARQGERGLYVTLSESNRELRTVARSHGWSLEGIDVFELTTDENLTEQYTILHPSEVELGQAMRAVTAEVERVEPARVVFDSLSELRLLARDPLRYRRQIIALKQLFTGRNCTVLLLDDGRTQDSDLQLRTLAHGVIVLDQLTPPYGGARRRLRVAKLRGVDFKGGFHDYVIQRGGVDVYPRLIAAEHHAPFVREAVSSGVPALDALLGGGVDRGTSTLLIGPAGAGKSTLAIQYAAAAARRGECSAFYLFEETVGTFRARASGLGLALDGAAARLVHLRQVDPAELSPGALVRDVRDRVERDGARVIVIDSLNGYLKAMPDERFLVVQLHELLSYLDQRGVVTFLIVAQHGIIGSMEQPVDVTYLADNVILLRYFEAAGAVRQAISVVKKRSGNHERTIRELRFGPGVVVGKALRHFQGVLTGVPIYSGAASALDAGDADG